MDRRFSVITTVFFMLIISSCLHAEVPSISIVLKEGGNNNKLTPGDTFLIDIKVGVNEEIDSLYGVSFILRYDSLLVEPMKVIEGNFLGSKTIFFPNFDPGEVAIGMTSTAGVEVSGTGKLASVRFRVFQNADTSSSVILSVTDIDANNRIGEPISIIGEELRLNFNGNNILSGDVDGNGKINIWDLLALLSYLTGTNTSYPGADVDGNGVVDIRDLLELLLILRNLHN